MKAVLAYSGGLDTSVCIELLKEKYECDVVTVIVDVGLPKESIEEAEKKAETLGVAKHVTLDVKGEFARDYAFRALKANALYEGYPLSTALARPLIASKVVEVAKKEGADALAHGATGKGNDQFRFETVFRSQAPGMQIIAPIRELNLTRKESIAYAEEKGIPIPVDLDKPYSVDENLWGRSIEGGDLEDPNNPPPEEIFEWTKVTVAETEVVEIAFEAGVPVALNGKKLPPADLVAEMNGIAGRHGVGRIDIVEDRILGIKTREVYECPAAISLITAHTQLEQLVLTREELRFKEAVGSAWSELVYAGLWTEPLKKDLDAFIDSSQERVSGRVMLELRENTCIAVGRDSKYSLYSKETASFDYKTNETAEGVLHYHALQASLASKLRNIFT
ncbi:MAG: argininosuccinate synthase [Candidatus Hydrothermarchaeales archaeon]